MLCNDRHIFTAPIFGQYVLVHKLMKYFFFFFFCHYCRSQCHLRFFLCKSFWIEWFVMFLTFSFYKFIAHNLCVKWQSAIRIVQPTDIFYNYTFAIFSAEFCFTHEARTMFPCNKIAMIKYWNICKTKFAYDFYYLVLRKIFFFYDIVTVIKIHMIVFILGVNN